MLRSMQPGCALSSASAIGDLAPGVTLSHGELASGMDLQNADNFAELGLLAQNLGTTATGSQCLQDFNFPL